MSVTRRNRVIGTVLLLIALPVLCVLADAAFFFIRNRNNGVLVSSGETRRYRLYVPGSYDRKKPTPLVISLHGAGGWPAQQQRTSEWNELADREGFIVVYPSGLGGAGPRIWRVERGPGLARDVKFISDLIDKLSTDYNIDRARVYANGLSNGGGMSFVLSCALSDRIAAVGLVAAAQTLPWSWCADARAVPVIWFHGTADPIVPYEGGSSWMSRRPFPSVPVWISSWAQRNGCAPTPLESDVASDVHRSEYTRCTDDASVVFYTIRDGGHTWPGGGPLPEFLVGRTSNGIDASRVMWEFFRSHPLVQRKR